jgi:hypothetical protein
VQAVVEAGQRVERLAVGAWRVAVPVAVAHDGQGYRSEMQQVAAGTGNGPSADQPS